jgi:hypothetical protein
MSHKCSLKCHFNDLYLSYGESVIFRAGCDFTETAKTESNKLHTNTTNCAIIQKL